MDIALIIFAMSQAQPLFEAPKQPTAVIIEVVKVNTETNDLYSDMWDPKWIEKK